VSASKTCPHGRAVPARYDGDVDACHACAVEEVKRLRAAQKDVPHETLQALRDEMAGRVLQEFVAEGGKGLKSALFDAMVVAIQWKAERDEKEKKAKK
jgi:hypothetical protein